MQISGVAFRQQFERFRKAVFLASHSEFQSFQEGLPKQWEGYKEYIYAEGRMRLDWNSWTAKDVQNGLPIVERAIKAIEIEKASNIKASNLVDWDSRYGPEKKSHKKLIAALENNARARGFAEVLFGLYCDEVPEAEAFDRFVQLAPGIRLPAIPKSAPPFAKGELDFPRACGCGSRSRVHAPVVLRSSQESVLRNSASEPQIREQRDSLMQSWLALANRPRNPTPGAARRVDRQTYCNWSDPTGGKTESRKSPAAG